MKNIVLILVSDGVDHNVVLWSLSDKQEHHQALFKYDLRLCLCAILWKKSKKSWLNSKVSNLIISRCEDGWLLMSMDVLDYMTKQAWGKTILWKKSKKSWLILKFQTWLSPDVKMGGYSWIWMSLIIWVSKHEAKPFYVWKAKNHGWF